MKIAHLTSAHPRGDTRIFVKMCRSLAAAGHEVYLVVADGKGDENSGGVHILDVGKSNGRLRRMTMAVRRVLARAYDLDADVYHLHDPELIPAGLALRRKGMNVIFDAHEDLPQQILSKDYIHRKLRRFISNITIVVEKFTSVRFNFVVAATPVIREKFLSYGANSIDIKNYPVSSEFSGDPTGKLTKALEVCYVGGLMKPRGVREIVEAMSLCRSETRLNLAGAFGNDGLRDSVVGHPGWLRVNELGFLDRAGVKAVLDRSRVGLVTLHPTPAYLDSLPIKMFEYMSSGLPVIASNFPLWQEIIGDSECGVCVDPLNPSEIAAAIDMLIANGDLARKMGENGRRAVGRIYNWAAEERRLLSLYDQLAA